MTYRVLLVDDDRQIVEWLSMELKLNGFSVDAFYDGNDGLQQALKTRYDFILLDVMMPELSGYEVCSKLRKLPHTRNIPVVLLTAKGTLQDKVTGFNCGADDYLVKPFDIEELLVRMRALMRRTLPDKKSANEIVSLGDIEIFPDSLEASINGIITKLTPTEFEILYCLMQHANQAVKYTTLLNEVWGYDADEDVRVVRVHMGGLRQKIEGNPKSPKYIHTVTNVGYKLVPYGET
jgi:two-component system, OmpR family, response regulator RpaA